jgi:hypothetical protein
MLGRLIVSALVITMATSAAAQTAPASVGPEVWRTFAERLPAGSLVKVRLQTGERFTATLIEADADGVLMQPKTRLAVPPQHVTYASITTMDQAERGGTAGIGKAIAIGAATGAGLFVGLLMILASAWD